MTEKPQPYIGIMSGTSLDGIDVALVDFPEGRPGLRSAHFRPYTQGMKDALMALHLPSSDELHRAQLIANDLAREYAAAVAELLVTAGIPATQVRAIGCHGQTVRHRPELGYTLQLGNHALLAELSGISVIGDFRSRDIAAGGQGAPLVPAFHDLALRHPDRHRVILNIGGIANLTDLPPGGAASGFDCGPGNMLMDAWISRHLGEACDRDGAWAAGGEAIPGVLNAMLKEPYFSAPPPKSSGRDLFDLAWILRHLHGGEPAQDVQATLLALTVHSIADAIQRYCPEAEEVFLCGGGAHNGALRHQLAQALPACRIALSDELGVGVDWMEAVAFAWLARQTMLGLPANLPRVTGARHPCILGAIFPS